MNYLKRLFLVLLALELAAGPCYALKTSEMTEDTSTGASDWLIITDSAYTSTQKAKTSTIYEGVAQAKGQYFSKGDISAAVTAIGSTACELYVDQDETLGAGLTIPLNITLIPINGAVLTVPNGITLAVNGPIRAGPYQLWNCTGTGAVTIGGPVKEIYPEWWGNNTSPGTTDMSDEIRAALLCASAGKAPVRFQGKEYLMTAPFLLYTGLVVEGSGRDSTTIINATDTTVVLTNSANPETLINTVYRPVIRDLRFKTTDTSSNAQVGANLTGVDYAVFERVAFENFQVGIRMARETLAGVADPNAQCYFNKFKDVIIIESETGIQFQDNNTSANSNIFQNIDITGASATWTGWTGINLTGVGNSFRNIHINGGYPLYGFYIGGISTATAVSDNVIDTCYFESLINSASSWAIYSKDLSSRVNYARNIHVDGTQVTPWVTGTTYTYSASTNQYVYEPGTTNYYKLLKTHTSGTLADDITAGDWDATTARGVFFDEKNNLDIRSQYENKVASPVSSDQNSMLEIAGNVGYGGATYTRKWGLVSGVGKNDDDDKTVPTGSFAIKNRIYGAGTMPLEIKESALDDALKINSAGVVLAGVHVVAQGDVTAETTAVTLTIAKLLTGIITGTHATGSNINYQLPTGTAADTGTVFDSNFAFDWTLINLSAAAADTITITSNTDHTCVGNMVVQSAHSTTGGTMGNSARFRTRKTGTNTFVTYRLS